MAIHQRQNQYPGINAHLHSYLQHEPAGWEEFHAAHITHLAEALDALLPAGYLVHLEKGMQIRELHPETGEPVLIRRKPRPRPDVSVLRTPEAPAGLPAGVAVLSLPTRTLPATQALEDDPAIYLMALSIRPLSRDGRAGTPITWIELLSPTNKPGGSGALQYREKRALALHSGLALVEIDYLHETPPVLSHLPDYAGGEPGAYPYRIIVTDPRPSLAEGEMLLYEIAVDSPLPVVKIPLLDADFVALDCGAVYGRTFQALRAFSYAVDYEQFPLHMERYHPNDQAKIAGRMALVKTTCLSTSERDQPE